MTDAVGITVGACVRAHGQVRNSRSAFLTPEAAVTWAAYDAGADSLAAMLVTAGVEPGDRVAVVMPDGPGVHAVYVGAERVGAVVVGIGFRAGLREIGYLVTKTGASLLVTEEGYRTDLAAEFPALRAMTVPHDLGSLGRSAPPTGGGLGPDDLFLINSTSGTTGLPKCVMHAQRRWFAFHRWAVDAGALTEDEVVYSAIGAPFGFGLWTAHVTPAVLGCPTVLADRFDAAMSLDLIERHRVTVLACVSTQFIMMLEEQRARPRDLSSLRCMFTGGESVPYGRAAEFEDRTGAVVLQFYGSNETGALSRTTVSDTRERRLRTAGHVLDEMNVRLFDTDGTDITGEGRPGIPGCRGPATCLGYYGDDDANRRLLTPDGWMLMGDIVEIDDEGYLTVVGRSSDFIIRGGKNISAPQVEAEVATHPGVAMVAAVAMPDDVFGERVCAYVEVRPGWEGLTLVDITDHLASRGVTKEWFPEKLILVDSLPRSSGGKIAKGELRDDALRRRRSVSGAVHELPDASPTDPVS
ncbi:MAG TPA: class I adenylate-forming enzyme family protein [Acidimicrobiales bacterium]|nr:class I adenylate-forming enzyme family protein [Acidimicrobiales bacterium]